MKDKRILVVILSAVLLLGGLASISAKTVLSDHIMSLIKGTGGECGGDYCFCSEESDCGGYEPECDGVLTCAADGCQGTGCGNVCSESFCDQHVVEDSEWSCNGETDYEGRCGRACHVGYLCSAESYGGDYGAFPECVPHDGGDGCRGLCHSGTGCSDCLYYCSCGGSPCNPEFEECTCN